MHLVSLFVIAPYDAIVEYVVYMHACLCLHVCIAASTELAPQIDVTWTKPTPAASPPAGVRIDSNASATKSSSQSGTATTEALIDNKLLMATRINALSSRLPAIGHIDCVFITGIDYLARSDAHRNKVYYTCIHIHCSN
jgi:hypothetical protein